MPAAMITMPSTPVSWALFKVAFSQAPGKSQESCAYAYWTHIFQSMAARRWNQQVAAIPVNTT
jgi:hypothetical protein